jgi:MFS family permease
LFVVRRVGRHLQESRRFVAPHAAASMAGHGRRFWLLAMTGLLLNILVAPASAFQNRYLKRERGYSASKISLYTLCTNTPGAIGIVAGGRLADTRGRRRVGAIALGGGVSATIATFFAHGWLLWSLSATGSIVGAAAAPALGVYQAELFPTSLRGRANGIIGALALAGSGVGLVITGLLVDRWDHYGPAMALMGVGPLCVVFLVLFAYPETARIELEVINPEDALARPSAGPGEPDADPTRSR